jgi:asparagine synthase (glutamine-hydrolysing)
MLQTIDRVIDLTDPTLNDLLNVDVDRARSLVAAGDTAGLAGVRGSFALVGVQQPHVRLARTLDRPLRYFLAKRVDGPLLIVADRMDAIAAYLDEQGLTGQFHPSYTRMVPAHHIVEIHLIGCPDPNPRYERFFTPAMNALSTDLDAIGAAYIGRLAEAIDAHLDGIPDEAPVGVAFSGGVDSGAVLLVTEHLLLRRGASPARLKAFTLGLGGPDAGQARDFLRRVDRELYLESVDASADAVDLDDVLRTIEDYKPLDVEAAAMSMALLGGIRERYPDWVHLLDGDGGDENLKDYPIDANPELTIRSVLGNRMLYQEGWGVDAIKHSLTYSGGQSRSAVRGWAPAQRFGFRVFSPFMRRSVIEVAEGIPFVALTEWDEDALYALKGDVTRRGVLSVTGVDMPVFPKRRFQHGAVSEERLASLLPGDEQSYRRRFHAMHA